MKMAQRKILSLRVVASKKRGLTNKNKFKEWFESFLIPGSGVTKIK